MTLDDVLRRPSEWDPLAAAARSAIAQPLSRRAFLKRSLGSAVLLAVPGAFVAGRAAAATRAATPFLVYGLPDSALMSNPVAEIGLESGPGAPVTLNSVAQQLAALPVRSPDRTKLAVIGLAEAAAGVALSVTMIDMALGTVSSAKTTVIGGVPSDAEVLVTPVFAADSVTVAIVLSITIPTNWSTIQKVDPRTGGTLPMPAAAWTSHHELLYYNSSSSSFAGPFDLADAPSLARVTVAASSDSLFLWTLTEPAAVIGTKEHPKPMPTPQLSVFPLGSGRPSFTTPASPVWPVSDEPTFFTGSGTLARLVGPGSLELYSTSTGAYDTAMIDSFDVVLAKPSPTEIQSLPDGNIALLNASLGRAAVINPATLDVVHSVTFDPPSMPRGTPTFKGAVSADGSTLYVPGGRAGGGLAAYDLTSGSRIASRTDGQQYDGVRVLSGQALVAIAPRNPRLVFFDPMLKPLGTAATDLNIVEVYA